MSVLASGVDQLAVENDDADSKTLHAELRKLRLESKLRKNLSTELEKQKSIAVDAQKDALNKTNELEAISHQLSKYLSPQLYQSIFSGEQKVNRESKRKKLTLFFSDLVSFTSISDSLESEEITSMLNYYLTVCNLLYHFVLLCITLYHFVPLCTTLYNFAQPRTTV